VPTPDLFSTINMTRLEYSDQRHLKMAQGWIGLGNWLKADEELQRISAPMHGHPDVLSLKCDIYARAQKWELAAETAKALTRALPGRFSSWLRFAQSLHAMNRTREAIDVLLLIVDKFPDNANVPYCLACYTCRLGDLEASRQWLEKAFELTDESKLKEMASRDPALKELWGSLR